MVAYSHHLYFSRYIQKITFQMLKFYQFINENYSPDDVINVDKLDFRKEFQKVNSECFDNKLPLIDVRLEKTKRRGGAFIQNYDEVIRDYRVHITISTFFKKTYQQFLNVLAHEMIHYYVYLNYKRVKDSHGWEFQKEMNRINNLGLGYRITLKDDEAKELADGIKVKPFTMVAIENMGFVKLAGTGEFVRDTFIEFARTRPNMKLLKFYEPDVSKFASYSATRIGGGSFKYYPFSSKKEELELFQDYEQVGDTVNLDELRKSFDGSVLIGVISGGMDTGFLVLPNEEKYKRQFVEWVGKFESRTIQFYTSTHAKYKLIPVTRKFPNKFKYYQFRSYADRDNMLNGAIPIGDPITTSNKSAR